MTKRLAFALIALASIVGFAPAALAGGSGPQPPAVVDDESVTITATGCEPGSDATFNLEDADGNVVDTKTAVIGNDGTATVTFDGLPTATYTADYDCPGTTQVLNNIVVQPASQTQAAALPNTGSDATLSLARLGFVLVAAGGVAVYAAQRRKVGADA